MMGKADLHLHTTASDGRSTPEELVQKASEAHLSVISVTDHDTTAGISRAKEEARSYNIEVLNGVEITCLAGSRNCTYLPTTLMQLMRILSEC